MTLVRTFNAPLQEVWKAWSKAELIKLWWGPEGFTAPLVKVDFKEGGSTFVCMSSPDFGDIYNIWTYQKIDPRQRIVFISHFADKDRNHLDPADLGLPPGIPREVPHTILFRDLGEGRTEVEIVEAGYGTSEVVELSRGGMNQCLDKMAKALDNN